ncbi:hypothetical protein ACKI1O_52090, partial [Streptomyces scabiei]
KSVSNDSIKIVNNRIINTNIVPYINSDLLEMVCTGFVPNSRLYVYMDNIDITGLCYPIGGNSGDSIVCDSNGSVGINVLIPNT